jgi:hypothetical protein
VAVDDEAITRLADIVSERVFTSMSKFVDALEALVRENELLRTKVAHLELIVFSDDPDDPDDNGYEPVPEDEIDDFFDVESAWEPEDDDSEPTFD